MTGVRQKRQVQIGRTILRAGMFPFNTTINDWHESATSSPWNEAYSWTKKQWQSKPITYCYQPHRNILHCISEHVLTSPRLNHATHWTISYTRWICLSMSGPMLERFIAISQKYKALRLWACNLQDRPELHCCVAPKIHCWFTLLLSGYAQLPSLQLDNIL